LTNWFFDRSCFIGVESEARVGCKRKDTPDQPQHSWPLATSLIHLEQVLLVDHEHIVLQGDDDVLVRSVLELVCDNVRLILLDVVLIELPLLYALEVPCVAKEDSSRTLSIGCNRVVARHLTYM
jgi:hypothetical protein